MHGKGIMIFPNGDKFEGEFANDSKTKGTYTYKNGDVWVGPCKNNMLDGVGKLTRKGKTTSATFRKNKHIV